MAASVALGALLASGCTTAGPVATSPAPAAQAADGAAVGRAEAAETALADHLRAAQDGDLAAWLAPVDGAALRVEQRAVFDRMRRIGVTDLRLGAVTETSHDAEGWSVHALATYRIAGHDRALRSFDVNANLRLSGDPVASASAPSDPATVHHTVHDTVQVTSWGPATRPQPWDLDGLVVRRTPDALVLAVGADRADQIASLARLARRDVTAVWGSSVSAVWVAPGDDAAAGRMLGEDVSGLAGVAGVTDGPLEGESRRVPTGSSSCPGPGTP